MSMYIVKSSLDSNCSMDAGITIYIAEPITKKYIYIYIISKYIYRYS